MRGCPSTLVIPAVAQRRVSRNVMEAVVLGHVRLSLRATMSRISSSAVAIASGMSIGREGPLIEFGGSLGAASGRWMRTSLNETRVLVTAGVLTRPHFHHHPI
jgi:H+/Cl- antiporter ClcA